VLEYGRDSNGKRLQTTRSGFDTKSQAQTALEEAVRVHLADVSADGRTLGEYLKTWLAGKRALKPKTAALYRDASTSTSSRTSARSGSSSCDHTISTASLFLDHSRRTRTNAQPKLEPHSRHTAVCSEYGSQEAAHPV
jgi:hypothetical protein